RVLDQLEQERLSALYAQVERAALLVPRLHRPPQRVAFVARLAPLAERVGLTGRLDLDDLGAHVAEQTTREGTGEQHPELDHANAGQRPGAVASASSGRRGDGRVGHSGFPEVDCWIGWTGATRRARASDR